MRGQLQLWEKPFKETNEESSELFLGSFRPLRRILRGAYQRNASNYGSRSN